MVVLKTNWLPRHVDAMTICGLVLIRPEVADDPVLLNHERIHCRQQRRWLYLPFFVAYLIEWLWHLIRLRDAHRAYRAISFEREAYAHQHDLSYTRRK